MPSISKRSAKKLAPATPCDFSTFEIGDDLKRQLEHVGSFGCDTIWYGEGQKTMTSGHIDGYRWLFAVMTQEWFFLVFKQGDEQSVQWENSKKLSFEESWELYRDLQPEWPQYLRHPQVFQCLLQGVEEFRGANPFND